MERRRRPIRRLCLSSLLSTFWSQFFNSLTVGTQEKVPAIRHDYQRAEWEAIARILMYGVDRQTVGFPMCYHIG